MNNTEMFLIRLVTTLAIRLREAQEACSKLTPEDAEFDVWIQMIKDLDKMVAEQSHTLSLMQDGII